MDLVTQASDSGMLPVSGGHAMAEAGAYGSGGGFAEPDSGGILRRLLRRKFVFTAAFLATAALVAAVYFYLPGNYKAEALVTIASSDQVLPAQRATEPDQMSVGDTSDLETQALILASPTLLREVLQQPAIRDALLRECKLAAPPHWKVVLRSLLFMSPTPSCPDQLADTPGMVGKLHARVLVQPSGRSRVLSVSVASRLPDVARLLANDIVQVYLASLIREKLQPRDAALAWLRDESQRVGNRLKETELRIQDYLQANGVIRGQAAPLASEQLTSLAQQIGLAETQQAAAAGRLEQARVQDGTTSAVLGNQTTNGIKQQLVSVTAQIAQLSQRYGSANPALIALQQQQRELQRLLGRETGVVNRSAGSDYAEASSRVDSLRRQLDALKHQVQSNDTATTQVAALQREAETDRELYVDLAKSLNQLETDRRLVTPNARLVSWAEPPGGVFFPKASVFELGGALLATAMATLAALLLDHADRTVRTVAVLQSAADLRVLTRIPQIGGLRGAPSRLLGQMQHPSAFQEAIRRLYAECLLLGRRSSKDVAPPRSFMVTSSTRGEGKTLTTIAMAQFAAAAGRRVLMLECDLRRPDIGRSLGLSAQPGVTDVLRRQLAPSQAVRPSQVPGLDVMLAGKAATDSAELLGSRSMSELLAWATATYDLVFLDTPPSRLVPDARILAASVDCVLYCARWGNSSQDSVVEGVRDIQSAGGRVLGLVLGRVQPTEYRRYNADDLGVSFYPALTEG